jgi:creatinine amidohydrolase
MVSESGEYVLNEKSMTLGKQTDASIFLGTMVEMTWPEIKKSAEDGDIVLFPVGTIEEHGPHMDLSPDAYLAYLYCRLLKQSLGEKEIGSIIAPPYYWGICEAVKKYPGTFSIRPETMKAVLIDLFESVLSWGFNTIFIINAHGDRTHVKAIEDAAQEIRERFSKAVYNLDSLDITVENPPRFPAPRLGRFVPDIHAGAIETAAMHLFFPDKVKTEIARAQKPQKGFHPMGYLGDPASFELDTTVAESYKADIELDTRKIITFLNMK